MNTREDSREAAYLEDAKTEVNRVATDTHTVVTCSDSFARITQSAGGARTVAIANLTRVAHSHGFGEFDLDALLELMPVEKATFAAFKTIGEAHGAHRSLTLPGREG